MAGSGGSEWRRRWTSSLQELCGSASVSRFIPEANVCIELGGEDAKLTFFDPNGTDQRMNETCAGGTGAFLDHMAMLMGTDTAGLNELASKHRIVYPIASRCGVFAKTDVQALMKEGADRADIAASIFQAVVNQTKRPGLREKDHRQCGISRRSALFPSGVEKEKFAETLKLGPGQSISPENSHLFVALGAALLGKKNDVVTISELDRRSAIYSLPLSTDGKPCLPPLFRDAEERMQFSERHGKLKTPRAEISRASGPAYLGIDVV